MSTAADEILADEIYCALHDMYDCAFCPLPYFERSMANKYTQYLQATTIKEPSTVLVRTEGKLRKLPAYCTLKDVGDYIALTELELEMLLSMIKQSREK